MILKTIQTNKAYNLLVVPLLSGILWIKLLSSSAVYSTDVSEFQMPLFKVINDLFSEFDLFPLIFSQFLIVVQGFLLIRLNDKYIIINKRTYLQGIIFTILSVSLSFQNDLQAVLCANIFLIIAIEKIFDTYKSEDLFSNFFDAALLISIASLFYFNIIFLIVFVLAGQIVIHSFKIREWLLSIFGIITPYLIIFLYYSLIDNLMFFNELADYYFNNYQNKLQLNLINIGYYTFVLLLFLISGIYVLNKFNKLKINRRKYFTLFFLLILFSFIILYALPKADFEIYIFVLTPISFVISDYLLSIKKQWFSELVFMLLLAGSILAQIVEI